jgi:hypothetical protein
MYHDFPAVACVVAILTAYVVNLSADYRQLTFSIAASKVPAFTALVGGQTS